MKKVDLIPTWSEPLSITEWGGKFKKTIIPAWESYLNMESHPDDLIVFFRVILPAFVVIKDCTLLQIKADGYSKESLVKFIEQAPSREEFEKNFNNFKIYDLFSGAEVSHESSFEQAAELLKRSWEIALAVAFPQKKFVVSLTNTDRDYGPTLSFYTLREKGVGDN
jgi:hypothetical protein